MNTPFLVAAFPLDIRPGEVGENLESVLGFLEGLPEQVRIVLLPEKWTTSFLVEFSPSMLEQSNQALERVHGYATAHNLVVVGSAPSGDGPKPSNETHVLGVCGNLRPYRKQMLFSPTGEGRQVLRGNQPPQLVTTPWASLSTLICYDLRFPEITRQAFYDRADILLVSAQWPSPRAGGFDLLVRARAAENQQWVLACNRSGKVTQGGRSFEFPDSAWLVNPLGEVVASGCSAHPLVGEVDLEAAAQAQKQVPCARDLKAAGMWPSSVRGRK